VYLLSEYHFSGWEKNNILIEFRYINKNIAIESTTNEKYANQVHTLEK